ncbi:unnamed protein product [Cochlearia groenlandica]
MDLTIKHHFITLLLISYTLFLFAYGLDLSQSPAEAPSSGDDGILPLAEKHVIIRNTVRNKQSLNVHCWSSQNDLGLIHIPWNQTWGFNFHVNMWKTTRFRCHFTWFGGGSHYFDIFKVSRDDSEFHAIPPCKVCIWHVDPIHYRKPMCRVPRADYDPFCFNWDD